MMYSRKQELISHNYQEIRRLDKKIIELQKEIREIKKSCQHVYDSGFNSVDQRNGYCMICKEKTE
jgi:hypothetical protein